MIFTAFGQKREYRHLSMYAFTYAGELPHLPRANCHPRACALWATAPTSGGEDYRGKEAQIDRLQVKPFTFTKLPKRNLQATPEGWCYQAQMETLRIRKTESSTNGKDAMC